MSAHEPHGSVEVVADPIADPGLSPHLPRPTDVDPAKEKRAERQVATLFGLSAVASILFAVAYFSFAIGENPDLILGFGASHVALGLSLGVALLGIGIGAILLARKLMDDHEIVEYRHPAASSEEDRKEAIAALTQGIAESTIGRRPLVRNSMLAGLGLLGVPAVVALADLGPLPGDTLAHTVWGKKKLMRLVQDVSGTPIKPEDIEIGQLINGEPEIFFTNPESGEAASLDLQAEKAKAAIIVVRMQPDEIKAAQGREDWGVDGILCFSKICTHVGCPISLWEQQTHHLLCPCHQSTFDLADNGRVIFGPAARALPQLPITVDSEGYLAAQSDFTEPVGPSYWERVEK